ncbi:hypothetical protein DMA15_32415 [Streptomyces sp. WAC 01529]|uniref:SAV_2336 N-terminal domain-related protein n=1 Tax=Streptomyces sp. WAC 01529 TaxID=2203205 RepID=UPI000F6BDC28|nr:SAV_2336 N-terminal domain-related protein [Streptomyces sp. WAC 01529]AZM56705.1 hypothetical protein DMA15_32415 [Streptomyces sp. WAC 01529]
MTIDRLRDALEALGPPVTPLELAEMLWLAERLPPGEGAGAASSAVRGDPVDLDGFGAIGGVGGVHRAGAHADTLEADRPPGRAPESDREGSGSGPGRADGAPHRAALHVPRGAPRPGGDADEVLVPAPRALCHELAIQRALRPLKQRVPDRHRRTLDERATAERASRHPGLRPWAPVMVPAADRLLSLALVADTGPAMTVWRPLVRELRDAMQRTGAFRDVRVWHLTDDGRRTGVRSSPGGPLRDPAALVDATGRQVTLVLSDCSGPHWWGGRAAPALHLWARRGPTAIVQPLPERLWRRTAAPAVPGRAIASRAGAPNTVLRFTPHDGRARFPPADHVPVPVLELAPEWLADWAGLVTASGEHRRDTAVTYVSAAPPPRVQPLAAEGDLPLTERILRFQAAASPTAADLAAHVALSVPALPVMRLIQQRVTPGSHLSDLAELLLSGLLEPVDPGRGLYDFVPGARSALLETLPRPESLAVADLLTRIGEEIEARAGSATRAFRAVVQVAQGAGSLGLDPAGQPFALVSEEALGLLRGRAIRVAERPVEERPVEEAGDAGEPGSSVVVDVEAPRLAVDGLAPPESVRSAPGLTNIPERPQLYFVGRVREIGHLMGELRSAHAPPRLPRGVVVHGPPGIGKSALAAVWAAGVAASGKRTPVWWVTADSPASIAESLALLTRALQPAGAPLLPEESRVEWALRWLRAHDNWALVFDDAQNPADIQGLHLGVGGYVLITSRNASGWGSIAPPLELRAPELPEAVRMLQRRAGRELVGAEALCEQLDRLPLAVARAGADLADIEMSVAQYQRGLALRQLEQRARYASHMETEDAVKVRLRAAATDPGALRLILALAWYGPQPVPLDLLRPPGAEADTPSALRFLADCSLIELTTDTVILHPNVAEAAREPDDGRGGRDARHIDDARLMAARWLRSALPQRADDPVDWPRWRKLLPHIDALLEHARPVDDNRHFVALLTQTAHFLVEQGESGKALTYLRRAQRDLNRLSGQEPLKTLKVTAQLARVCATCGATSEALHLYTSVLDALGSAGRDVYDPEVLGMRAERAEVHQQAGDPHRAVRELDEVCLLAARALGDDDPRALRMRARLAAAREAAGEWGRAVATYEQTLADCRRVSGEDSPDTLAVRAGLASACRAAGDLPRATEVMEGAVRGFRAEFGAHHPRTVMALATLAGLYAEGGRTVRAVEAYEEALGYGISALGVRHPKMLAVRQLLAETLLHVGDTERALPMLEKVLSDRGAAHGEDHSETLRSADVLAAAYGVAGARGEQRALYERTLAARLRVLEPNDPETLESYDRLADVLEAGNPEITLRVRAHHGRVLVLGEDHPETLAALDRLAGAHLEEENTEQGIALFRESLRLRLATEGPVHPDTLRVLGTLARIYLSEGDVSQALAVYDLAIAGTASTGEGRREAIMLMERALAQLRPVLGRRHREVRALQAQLARLR